VERLEAEKKEKKKIRGRYAPKRKGGKTKRKERVKNRRYHASVSKGSSPSKRTKKKENNALARFKKGKGSRGARARCVDGKEESTEPAIDKNLRGVWKKKGRR